MPERPFDDLAATLSGELQRFLRPQAANGEPADRPGQRIEPILQLLMTAAQRGQESAARKAEAAQRAPDDTLRRDLDQLAARVDALTQENRALERTIARLEGYVDGLRAQIAAGGRKEGL